MSIHTIASGTIKLSTVGILAPPDFPVAPYESIHKRVIAKHKNAPIAAPLLSGFQASWNAVVYRFVANVEHAAAFTQSVKENGVAPPMYERYVQEKELFAFFVTGLSVLESLAYSCYALGAVVNPSSFTMDSERARRNITPKQTAATYGLHFPLEQLSSEWDSLVSSGEFKELNDVRNTLAHRASPSRLIRNAATVDFRTGEVSDQTWQAEWNQFEITIDLQTTSSRHEWLAKGVGEITAAADKFTASHL